MSLFVSIVLLTMAIPNPSQPTIPDFYGVLGLNFNATSEEVRRAYFHRARQVHPDKKSSSNAEDWLLLNKAYTTLSDNIQRQEYNEHLSSTESEGVPDLTRLSLPSSVRLSEEFKSRFEHWAQLRKINGIGSFSKMFVTELKKLLEGRCKQLVRQEYRHTTSVPQKRKIIMECNYETMMKSIAGAINTPTSSPVVQQVTENLLRIIRIARTSKTSSTKTGSNNVPILDLSSIPANDLLFLLRLFTQTSSTGLPSSSSKNEVQSRLLQYIPVTVVDEHMLKKEVVEKCGQCQSRFFFFSRSRYVCSSCGCKFCKICTTESMKAPRIGIHEPQPICQECTTKLANKDAEDWTAKALEIMKSGKAGSHRQAMACVLMAVHSTKVLPMPQLRAVAKKFIEQGSPEQAFVILSVLKEVSEANQNIRVCLPAVKALQDISRKPGKTWREKWLLVLMAHQAANSASENVALSDSSIDVPELSGKLKELTSSIIQIESEKEKDYDAMVRASLFKLEKAWECRNLSEILSIVTTYMEENEEALIIKNGKNPAIKALRTFLQAKKGFLPQMMAEDQTALTFLQGFASIHDEQIVQGLDCIEKAFWSGHHNRWLSEATIPIVMSQLAKHPSMKNEMKSVCEEIIQTGSSGRINFNSLLHILNITQEDLNPTVKPCWPGMYVPGINQNGTRKYESTVVQQVQEGKFSYCDAGYALIDFVVGASHPAEVVLCFLNAALWFLKELRTTKSQSVYAVKMISLSCLQHAYCIALHALHPGMQFYTARFALAIAVQTIEAAGKFATSEDTEFVVELIHTVMYRGRFCPFWKIPIVSVSEAVLLNIQTGRLHTEFMLALQKHPKNCLLEDSEVKYQLYENDLRWTCRVEDQDATRARAMEVLLKDKGLSWSDISDSMCSPLNPRSPDGWLLQQKQLGGNLEYAELRGFEFNIDADNPSVKLIAVPARNYQGKCGLFSQTDVHTVLQIPSDDLFPIFFSLDPPSETQRFHPFQELRFQPSTLKGTDLLYTLLQTDYLMKCFSVGSDVSAKPPFHQRGCSEGLTANLPPHLKRALAPVSERGSSKSRTSRFWIQADEIEYTITQTGSNVQCRLGSVKMVIRTQPQFPGLDGKLHDTEDNDPNSPESKFAKDLTDNYDDISKYFPMFGRLRELCKLQSFGVILELILKDMRQKADGEGITVPPQLLRQIQSQARSENESRVQQMLRGIKGKVGEWPAAQNSSMVSDMASVMREHIRSQHGYSTYISRENETLIYDAAKERLRKNDQQVVDQITEQLTEALAGRYYRGNIRSSVRSWLSYGSCDLENLVLSTMPVPTEQDIKQLIMREKRKQYNAFKSKVQSLSTDGRYGDKRTCTWVPAALNVEESDDGNSMRLCYGGVLLAPKFKESSSIRWSEGDVRYYDVNRLAPSRQGIPYAHLTTFSAPSRLSTRKNGCSDRSTVPSEFMPQLKPIRLHLETLTSVQISIQTIQDKLSSLLSDVLATIGGGRKKGSGSSGSNLPLLLCTGVLLTFIGGFVGVYEQERLKREKGRREHIGAASESDKKKHAKLISTTDDIRHGQKIRDFRESEEKRGVSIDGMHAAHQAGLGVVRQLVIRVDGKELTDDDVSQIRKFFCEPFNLKMAPARVNQSEHTKKDYAWIEALKEYLKNGSVSKATWEGLDLTWIKNAIAIFKRDACPVAVYQRVQIMRQITNPSQPSQNLWDL